jgi:cellobiose phosphorylase
MVMLVGSMSPSSRTPRADDAVGTTHLATNPYGYYDRGAREYVITRPDTPAPWINYLGQGSYGGIISNTAGGFSFDRDPRNRRVSRYRYNSLPPDQPGRYVYLRRKDTGEYWGACPPRHLMTRALQSCGCSGWPTGP